MIPQSRFDSWSTSSCDFNKNKKENNKIMAFWNLNDMLISDQVVLKLNRLTALVLYQIDEEQLVVIQEETRERLAEEKERRKICIKRSREKKQRIKRQKKRTSEKMKRIQEKKGRTTRGDRGGKA